MKSRVKDEDVTAHVFEYTTTFGIDPDLRFRYPDKGIVPTQIIFCLKERNAKKINSHRWLFNAFGRVLQVGEEANRGCTSTELSSSRTSVYYWTSALDQALKVFITSGSRSTSTRISEALVEKSPFTRVVFGRPC